MMGSIDFATKLKITPQTLIPGFGNFYRAALLSGKSQNQSNVQTDGA